MSWEHVDAAFRFNASKYQIKNTLAVGCKLFILTLANYINKDTLLCIPSLETLSRDMGIGIKQTREYKKELIAKGVISCRFIKGYKSPNFKLHLNHTKRIKNPPPQDTRVAADNLTTTSGELMTYPSSPFSTPSKDTLTLIKPLSNPIYDELRKENKEKYIIAVSNYAESLGIDTNKKGITMVEDEIKLVENPVFKPLTKEQRNAYLEKARELLSKGGGVKIIK